MGTWKKKLEKIAQDIEFTVHCDSDNNYDFAIFSPNGQDCHIEINGTTLKELIDELEKWINSYDISYETYIWLDNSGHGTNGAPYDMRDVYEDMEWFYNKTIELKDKLWTLR